MVKNAGRMIDDGTEPKPTTSRCSSRWPTPSGKLRRAAVRVRAVPGRPVLGRHADRRSAGRGAVAARRAGLPGFVRGGLTPAYFEVARRCLRDDGSAGGGLFLLHTIGSNVSLRHTDRGSRATSFPTRCCRRLRRSREPARAFRDRGLARLRHRLRPHPAGLARQLERAWPRCRPATTSASGACGAITSPPRWRRSAAAARSCGSALLSPRGVPGGCANGR